MIWYLGLFLSTLLAIFLAWRSMKDFQDDPLANQKNGYSLFLVKHPHQLTTSLFNNLTTKLGKSIASFEHIQKGNSQALVTFLPKNIIGFFPSLGLVEIEDYIAGKNSSQTDLYIRSRQIALDHSYAGLLQLKKGGSLKRQQSLKFDLVSDQYFCLQAVFQPLKDGVQLTLRTLIKEVDPQIRVELIKKVKQFIDQQTSLTSQTQLSPSQLYDDYKKRTLIPQQVQSFVVSDDEILNFLRS